MVTTNNTNQPEMTRLDRIRLYINKAKNDIVVSLLGCIMFFMIHHFF